MIIYSDVYFELNLRDLFVFHKKNRNHITCVSHPNDHPFDSDILRDQTQRNIIRIHSHPHEKNCWLPNNVNAALYCKCGIFRCTISKDKFDLAQQYLPKLIRDGFKVVSYKTVEYIKDMGTPRG